MTIPQKPPNSGMFTYYNIADLADMPESTFEENVQDQMENERRKGKYDPTRQGYLAAWLAKMERTGRYEWTPEEREAIRRLQVILEQEHHMITKVDPSLIVIHTLEEDGSGDIVACHSCGKPVDWHCDFAEGSCPTIIRGYVEINHGPGCELGTDACGVQVDYEL